MRICFLIRQLNDGGAQRQLVKLAAGLVMKGHQVFVITFYPGGRFSEQISGIPGITHISLNKQGRFDLFGFLLRLHRTLKTIKPDILHGYLNTSNALSAIIKPFFPKTRIIWGVRSGYMDLDRYNYLEKWLFGIERILSHRAELVITNSDAGRDFAIMRGFPKERLMVINNGIDTNEFRPSPDEGLKMRKEWGFTSDQMVIGIVGRIDPMKDHETFIKAAQIASRHNSSMRFVCVGGGQDDYVKKMRELAENLGVSSKLLWVDPTTDMRAVYNALDILTSSSYGESFSNVIGEAMSCGIPCVVTDVGDSAKIVSDTGLSVPARNPEALAHGWLELSQTNRTELGLNARSRIIENFSLNKMVEQTEEVLCLSA